MILSDFACLEAENSTEESEQASSNEKVVIESSEDNAVWEVEQTHDRQDGSARALSTMTGVGNCMNRKGAGDEYVVCNWKGGVGPGKSLNTNP